MHVAEIARLNSIKEWLENSEAECLANRWPFGNDFPKRPSTSSLLSAWIRDLAFEAVGEKGERNQRWKQGLFPYDHMNELLIMKFEI